MLNSQQQKAVETLDGNLLIIAGAGTGKTTTLVERYKNLLHKTTPENILMITFTNKAANEMKERVLKLVPEINIKKAWINNFHKICIKILNEEGHHIGIPPKFAIANKYTSNGFIMNILNEMGLRNSEEVTKDLVWDCIDGFKNAMIDVETYQSGKATFSFANQNDITALIEELQIHRPELYESLLKIYPLYQQALREKDYIDVNDMVLETVRLLDTVPSVKEKYRNQFHYIQVDEVQDTNALQFAFLRHLENNNLCAVGDDFQSIYGFRGSDIRNMLHFEEWFAPVRVVKLEENYRSTKRIIEASNLSISKNKHQLKKTLFTNNPLGEKISWKEVLNEEDEVQYIVSKIQKLVEKENYNYKDIAVLFRTNAYSTSLGKELYKFNIPFEVVGEDIFIEREEIKDLLAYLRIIENPNDFRSFRRIYGKPNRSLKATDADLILHNSQGTLLETLQYYTDRGKIKGNTWISQLSKFEGNLTLSETIENVLVLFDYEKTFTRKWSWEREAISEHIKEFVRLVREFEEEKNSHSVDDLQEWLENMYEETTRGNEIKLLTVHKAKGLEFPVVFVVGLNDGTFPDAKKKNNLDEERRLFYVAVTRAKEQLHLSRSIMKFQKSDKYEKTHTNTSPFIDEIIHLTKKEKNK